MKRQTDSNMNSNQGPWSCEVIRQPAAPPYCPKSLLKFVSDGLSWVEMLLFTVL